MEAPRPRRSLAPIPGSQHWRSALQGLWPGLVRAAGPVGSGRASAVP